MEITSGIHSVDGVNCNCYFVKGDDGWTLIDTGMPNNAKKILSYASDVLKIQPSDIKTIIITHAHFDHTGSLAPLKKITGAKVAVHSEDADFVSGKRKLSIPQRGMSIQRVMIMLLSPMFKAAPVQPDIILNEGDMIGQLKVLHTPGHTPGSICLLHKNSSVLFVGDLIRFMNGNIVGPPITMDANQIKESIAKISKLDFDVMLSGHGQPLMHDAAKKVRDYSSKM